jgi:hypothetical protein
VPRTNLAVGALTLALGASLMDGACHSGGGLAPQDGADASGAAGAAGSGAMDGGRDAPAPDVRGDGVAAATSELGFVGMRRLTDAEYARTLQDLLGLGGLDHQIVSSFSVAPDVTGADDTFDDVVNVVVSAQRYAAYFTNAVTYVKEAFVDTTLRARVVTCAPATPADDACTAQIMRAFGLRAWRRPLTDDEVTDLTAVVRADLATGDDFPSAIAEGVTTMLVSDSFLYRLEFDPPAPSVALHALTSYELATRLSYLLWSTTPDDALFALAATDDLQKPDVLTAQVTRMLADARSDGFVRNFLGQWLGFRTLDGAMLDRTPGWIPAEQASMFEEARLFATDFVQSDHTIDELLTNDVNFVDSFLSSLYGFSAPAQAGGFARLTNTTDARAGYLGLAAWLTLTSDLTASSPMTRGRWIDDQLLCELVPPPPNDVPLPPATGTPRQQYDDTRANTPTCAACHKLFEPLGLGLESFDQLGLFRTAYAGTVDLVDPTGALPDGTPFQGLLGLVALVSKSPQLTTCAARQLLTYALGRTLTDADASRVAEIEAAWNQAGLTMRGLLAAIVTDDIFRYRHAEVQP